MAVARTARIGGQDGERILVDGHRRLRAQQVVGILAAPSATLEILPKIDALDEGATRQRLVHMLASVHDLQIAAGSLTQVGWQEHDLLEVLIRLFCERLFQAVHRGMPRRYIPHDEDLPALRGRLDAVRQFTVLATRPHSLACRYEELSPDTPLNQIMRAAVTRLLKVARSGGNQRRLAELSLSFADVSVVAVDRLDWNGVVLDRTNSDWSALLGLARLLLGDRFQTTSSGGGTGFSLLFEMNTLFEEYVGRTLRRALAGTGLEVSLQGPGDHVLTTDDGKRRFATRPDIVVMRDGEAMVIIDTKWKRLKGALDDPRHGVGQADVYQMMAYAQVYRCRRTLLLYPHHGGLGQAAGLLAEYTMRGSEDTRLGVASVSLADLAAVGPRLGNLVLTTLGLNPHQSAVG